MLLGKWHLGMFKDDYLPQSRGFDTYYGLRQGGGDYYEHTGNQSTVCVYALQVRQSKNSLFHLLDQKNQQGFTITSPVNTCKYHASTFLCLLKHQCGALH